MTPGISTAHLMAMRGDIAKVQLVVEPKDGKNIVLDNNKEPMNELQNVLTLELFLYEII